MKGCVQWNPVYGDHFGNSMLKVIKELFKYLECTINLLETYIKALCMFDNASLP